MNTRILDTAQAAIIPGGLTMDLLKAALRDAISLYARCHFGAEREMLRDDLVDLMAVTVRDRARQAAALAAAAAARAPDRPATRRRIVTTPLLGTLTVRDPSDGSVRTKEGRTP